MHKSRPDSAAASSSSGSTSNNMASNYAEAPDAKKPCKGILKSSSSFDRPPQLLNHRKSAKFDELNVLQTFHPADKDYGHMRIDEPKTPYRVPEGEEDGVDQLDAEQLAEKLRNVPSRSSFSDYADDSPDEDAVETAEERLKRLEFEKRRKAHYNEFEAVRQARLLMTDDDDDDEDDEDDAVNEDAQVDKTAASTPTAAETAAGASQSSKTAGGDPDAVNAMDVDADKAKASVASASSSPADASTLVADDV